MDNLFEPAVISGLCCLLGGSLYYADKKWANGHYTHRVKNAGQNAVYRTYWKSLDYYIDAIDYYTRFRNGVKNILKNNNRNNYNEENEIKIGDHRMNDLLNKLNIIQVIGLISDSNEINFDLNEYDLKVLFHDVKIVDWEALRVFFNQPNLQKLTIKYSLNDSNTEYTIIWKPVVDLYSLFDLLKDDDNIESEIICASIVIKDLPNDIDLKIKMIDYDFHNQMIEPNHNKNKLELDTDDELDVNQVSQQAYDLDDDDEICWEYDNTQLYNWRLDVTEKLKLYSHPNGDFTGTQFSLSDWKEFNKLSQYKPILEVLDENFNSYSFEWNEIVTI